MEHLIYPRQHSANEHSPTLTVFLDIVENIAQLFGILFYNTGLKTRQVKLFKRKMIF